MSIEFKIDVRIMFPIHLLMNDGTYKDISIETADSVVARWEAENKNV